MNTNLPKKLFFYIIGGRASYRVHPAWVYSNGYKSPSYPYSEKVMPIRIDKKLPAVEILRTENIFVMDDQR
ncbi:hypothetical protein, partial [Hallella multisaccharivorax]|uniref:hypothetical protein n=1 Tax=Hallella multisaccharivorax TaxID=310514 RepID=UPI00360F4AEC